jgi:hypothetical protein
MPLLLAHCSSGKSGDDDTGGKTGGSSGQATGGSSTSGGSAGSTGGSTGGSATGGSGGSTGGAGGSTGGTTGGSSSGATGGTTGGSSSGTGGATGGTGGSTAGGTGGATGGTGGSTGGTGGSTGGTGATGGSSGGAGMSGSAGMGGAAGASTCAAMDMKGKPNWKPGDMTSTTKDYLRSCDVRLINNNWGASALGCGSDKNQYSVFVNSDGSFGWNFNRGDCDTQNSNAKPDFPEIEFGVHPFGAGSSDATTPDFSSTTLLPIKMKDIKSASVTINNLNVQLQQSTSWDLTFELWVSQQDPLGSNPGVYAELMTFWGWQNNRWPQSCPMSANSLCMPGAGQTFLPGDSISSGSKTYKLEVQADNWSDGKWRYFQFRAADGPSMSFSGKLDVKAITDYLVNSRGYSSDYYITRFEIGTEIDDMTQGKATVDSITFEVNGETRSAGKR